MNTRGLDIPLTQMGAVTSLDLFEEREQALFDFYERNAGWYKSAADIGANIGIHTILMARAGWDVKAYEPDPVHYAHLVRNINVNVFGDDHGDVQALNMAVSTAYGKSEFVRVMGNTTANHLAGARGCHGHTEKLTINTADCRPIFDWVDFAKIDVEGHEAAILCAVDPNVDCDFMVEVGSPENAKAIYEHFRGYRSMWAQDGRGWKAVFELEDVPTHYKDGALFIGHCP